MPIRLQTGQKITAKVIKHISGTAPIYIRALQELEEPETFTSDDQEPCGSVANSIQDYFNRDHQPPHLQPFHQQQSEEESSGRLSPSEASQACGSGVNTNHGGIFIRLKEVFPNALESTLLAAAQTSSSIDEAMDTILSNQEEKEMTPAFSPTSTNIRPSGSEIFTRLDGSTSLDVASVKGEAPFSQILKNFSTIHIDDQRPIYLEVDRSAIWKRALTFYKQAMGEPYKLKQRLSIGFDGEEGIDAGALRVEFFCEVLTEMNKRLFEGDECRRVPKKTFHGGTNYAIAGMMIGHSLLQNGPAFPCMPKAIYSYIATGCIETALNQLPTISDIPLDASTSNLHEFICKIDNCVSDEEVEGLFENNEKQEAYAAIINASGWPSTQVVNLKSKSTLIQQLVIDELIHKRKTSLDEIRKGLQLSGLFEFIQDHPELFKQAFVHTDLKVTATQIKELLRSYRPEEYPECQAHDWFMDFIDSNDKQLGGLLQFWIGQPHIPPMGLDQPLQVKYLQDDDNKVLPEAQSCFHILYIPVVHTTKDSFFKMMHQAIDLGAIGFGQM